MKGFEIWINDDAPMIAACDNLVTIGLETETFPKIRKDSERRRIARLKQK